mgnify:CR=1 FL=1
MLTIGYIGNGKSANRYHIPYVLTRNNIKIKTIYDLHISHDVWKKIDGVNYTENIPRCSPACKPCFVGFCKEWDFCPPECVSQVYKESFCEKESLCRSVQKKKSGGVESCEENGIFMRSTLFLQSCLAIQGGSLL